MLQAIRNRFGSLMNAKTIGIVLISALFIAISMYVYYHYVSPRLSPDYVANKEFVDTSVNDSKEVELYYFYTTWCPYCKKAKPIWDELKTKYETVNINNTKIFFKEVDCDKNEKLATEYNVEGYPTIVLNNNGTHIEYDAKPNLQNLEEFLHTTL